MSPINCIAKLFVCAILSALVLLGAASPILAAKNKRLKTKQTKLWQQVDESSVQRRGGRSVTPQKYLVFRLNETSLKKSLAELPLENTAAASEKTVVMEIPQPDGTLQRFKMEETQVLSAELAAQYPTWKTFVGRGVDDPTAIGRFDWNILGFHGMIETERGAIFIDPYQKGDTENYLVFYKHDFGASDNEFSCKVKDQMSKVVEIGDESFVPVRDFAFGSSLRTYKLAVATTGEWSRNAAGFGTNPNLTAQQIRDGALAAVVTTVNRLIGIFVREVSSSFQLVNPSTADNARNIIFDDPATDPYDNTDSAEAPNDQLAINQTTLNNRVGNANFDIGHLYGTGGGGVASSPSLCSSSAKAQGYSARGNDTGDPFTVDYVAHEIGHQFGAGHTYNNVDPSGTCTTRSAENAFEVASGATIMSYVGICAERNLQQFVDPGFPSFHIRSLTQMNANITDPNGDPVQTQCGTSSGTNAIPSVSAGNAFTIPKLTPFTLTATGNDADANDVARLLYSWEQYDLAPSASGTVGAPAGTFDVDTDGVRRSLFRAYSPVSSRARTFPSLAFILNPANNDQTKDVNGVRGNQPALTYTGTHPTNAPGAFCAPNTTCVIGERLPEISRPLNFRVSTRDRRGGVQDAGTTVTVAGDAGPFQVTAQNAAPAIWQGGTQQTVTWDVAGTNANGINTSNVNILLSTDGGQTFPFTIIANTPNDGSETITVPDNPTTAARIKIEAVGNIFFDISNTNFTVTGAGEPPSLQINDVTRGEGGAGFASANGSQRQGSSSSGFTIFSFTISLTSPAPAGGVTFDIDTDSGTASAGSDFIDRDLDAVIIPAGERIYTFDVEVIDDDAVEQTESFFVNLSNVRGADEAADLQGIGTIQNDEGAVCAGNTNSPFDVEADFAVETQPCGVFTSGSTASADVNSAFTAYPLFVKNNPTAGIDRRFRAAGEVVPAVFKNTTDAAVTYGSVQQPADVLNLHPAADASNARSVVRFTAPATATYAIVGRFVGLDNTTTDAQIVRRSGTNNTALFNAAGAQNVAGNNASAAFNLASVSLTAGDFVDFSVGNGGNGGNNDSTGLAATINTLPTITANNVTRQQQTSANSPIAAINDLDQTENSLGFTIRPTGAAAPGSSTTATQNGVTVSNIQVNSTGAVTADIAAATNSSTATFVLRVTDAAGNFAEATLTVTVTAETTAPTVTIADSSPSNQVGRRDPVVYTLTFSEPVSGVELRDVENAGSAVIAFSNFVAVSSTVYQLTATPTTTGTLQLRIRADAAITDSQNNALVVPVTDDDVIQVLLRRPRSSPTRPDIRVDDEKY